MEDLNKIIGASKLQRDLESLLGEQRRAFSKGVFVTHLLIYPEHIGKGERDIPFFTRVAGEEGYHMMLGFGEKPFTLEEIRENTGEGYGSTLIDLEEPCGLGIPIAKNYFFEITDGEVFLNDGRRIRKVEDIIASFKKFFELNPQYAKKD